MVPSRIFFGGISADRLNGARLDWVSRKVMTDRDIVLVRERYKKLFSGS